MWLDWNAIRVELAQHLEHYISEHQHPVNQILHILGVPMLIMAVPAALVSPLLGVALGLGGAALQVVGHFLFESNTPQLTSPGPLYLLAAPLWVAEKLLQPLGMSVREVLRGAEAPTAAAEVL